ncbi:MAG TPA: hypothetical protein VMJ64_03830 [Anaerolineales bacterium]|nr:hypothetical protein [Anaerolineales bacterium]
MLPTIISWAAVGLVTVTSAGLLLQRDWRWDLGLLTAQYVGVAILVGQHWPLGMAAAKLVTGWMTTAALAITLTALPPNEEPAEGFWPQGRTFRLFMIGIVVMLAAALTPKLQETLSGIGAPVVAGTVILVGVGLVHLATNSEILRVIVSLLTVLSGFETLYAALEGSVLVAALLAAVTLGLGLVGAYLLIASTPEESL